MEIDVQVDFAKFLVLGCLSFAPLSAMAETTRAAVEEEFWFAGADDLERGFVAVFDSSSGIAFGLAAADGPTKALIGCNFLSFSRQDFLDDLERQRKILEMFNGFGAQPRANAPDIDDAHNFRKEVKS